MLVNVGGKPENSSVIGGTENAEVNDILTKYQQEAEKENKIRGKYTRCERLIWSELLNITQCVKAETTSVSQYKLSFAQTRYMLNVQIGSWETFKLHWTKNEVFH